MYVLQIFKYYTANRVATLNWGCCALICVSQNWSGLLYIVTSVGEGLEELCISPQQHQVYQLNSCDHCRMFSWFTESNARMTAVDSNWNVMAHSDALEGKWGGNWRMEGIASTLHGTSEHSVCSITTADANASAASSWTDALPPI